MFSARRFLVSAILIGTVKGNGSKIFNVSLNGDASINLHWSINYVTETVRFEIHLPSNFGWLGVGFSDRGDAFPADYCLLWKNLKGKIHLQDTYALHSGILQLDKQQDCDGFKVHDKGGTTKFTFTRKFDTCDKNDYIIEGGTTHIVWFKGDKKLYRANGINVTSSNKRDHGMVRVELLKNTGVNQELPDHVRTLDIFANDTKVPSVETTYWCTVVKLPKEFKKKHHIYKYEAVIPNTSQGVVHHMEVFHCLAPAEKDIPLYAGNCFAVERPPETQVCKRVLAAWAMGAQPFIYPDEASLPFGGEDFNSFIMLEVHYNNPEIRSGIIDTSGIRLYVSKVLKQMDAGIIELGLEYTDKMAIPPRQSRFSLNGYCTPACTSMGLPTDGITVFGSQLHTHLTGTKVVTRHFDAHGRELPNLNVDKHYSTHFQEIRRLKRAVKILPGESLITTCDYNTEDRENVTLGGFSISDEMCVNYIHYYPSSELEVCKSSISDQALKIFFRYMNEWEGQPTSPLNGFSDNYGAIEWNKMRVQLLHEVYAEAPLSMQCNMSSGDRFPGYWENAVIPAIATPLPPSARKCNAISK